MKRLLTILLSILLLTCWQQAIATSPPPTPPAVGPERAPEPLLLSPESYEEYAKHVKDIDYYPEQYTETRFQARIITYDEGYQEQPQQQHVKGVSGLGLRYGWTKHQWLRNIDSETHTSEVYNREIVVGIPLLLIAVSTVLSAALLLLEIYDRVGYNNAAENYYNYDSALGDC
jgi:hypothetical protein